jgi:multiple sugar transport system permease protein
VRARAIGKYAGAVILAIWVLFPMYLLTAGAFSAQSSVYQYPKSLWPDWSTGTMSFFWDSTGVPAALGRSAVVAAITLALSMLIGTPAGYAIARYRFRGKNAYQLSIVSTRAFPVVVLSIPLAVFFLQWGIYDTVWAVALMHTALVLPFVVLITTSVLAGVPVDLEEAAQVFGTSRLGAFWRVVLPLALPGLAAASPDPYKFAAAWLLMIPTFAFIFIMRRYILGFGVERRL